jgi:hypothetical protein
MPKKNSENGRGGSIALLRCGRASDFVGTLHENETLRFLGGESEPTVPLAVWRRLRSVWYSAESRYSCVLWHDYFLSSPFRFCTKKRRPYLTKKN